MKLGGYRNDGTMRVLIPGGMTVLLRGDTASPPIDDKEAEKYGPWIDPPTSLTWQERQSLGKLLDRAHTQPLHLFKGAPTEVAPAEKPLTKGDLLARITEIAQARQKEKDAAPAPAEAPAADTPADAPADTTVDKQADKQPDKQPDKPPDAAPVAKGPRSTLRRLKLEFESEDREGDEKPAEKPVSDVAAIPTEKSS